MMPEHPDRAHFPDQQAGRWADLQIVLQTEQQAALDWQMRLPVLAPRRPDLQIFLPIQVGQR